MEEERQETVDVLIMRITIPECKEVFGEDGDNNRTFLYYQITLMIMVRGLHQQHHHLGIGSPDYAETAIIDDTVRGLSSLYTLADLRQDYNSCAVLLRSLVDKIAVLQLVYANEDDCDRTFRHYVYALDGLEERSKMLEDRIVKDEYIAEDEFQKLEKQMDDARSDTKKAILYILEEIRRHRYNIENPDWVNAVIRKNKIWQYRDKFQYDKKGKNVPCYSWKDMYKLIDSREEIASFYSGYLSQFVHGLSLSSLLFHENEDNFESLLSAGICLQGWIFSEVRRRYDGQSRLKSNATITDTNVLFSILGKERQDNSPLKNQHNG